MGFRPVLIAKHSRPAEIAQLMLTGKTLSVIFPNNLLEDPNTQQFMKEYPKYQVVTNTELGTGGLLKLSELRSEYQLSTPKRNQGTILFTSGTTGNPKGVFTDMSSITTQCNRLRSTWEYTHEDHILHVLPTHHIHGLINALLTPLATGSSIEFCTQPFNAQKILERIALPDSVNFPRVTMFHGVPTMYASFISAYETFSPSKQEEIAAALRRLRVAVCGSAALPVPIAEKWKKITGAIPLERYGMTETGMVFSNTLDPEQRILGSVGYPFPGIIAHLMDPNKRIIPVSGVPGELIIQWQEPSQLFRKYWGEAKATNKAMVEPNLILPNGFDGVKDGHVQIKDIRFRKNSDPIKKILRDGWFRTGDVAMRGDNGELFMLGRASVDVFKVAGHLVSALEVERQIISLEEIEGVAVVGVPSERFGKIPQAIVKLKPTYAQRHKSNPNYKKEMVSSLRKRLGELLSPEKMPRKWILVDEIPRNAMGKVNKKELLADKTLFPSIKEPIRIKEIEDNKEGCGKEYSNTKEGEKDVFDEKEGTKYMSTTP
ncbi:hypothetical protein ABW20_dc0106241 [Dactylellina cionopaga]|nr:hypothetical protein ABW20_dc0106241 [Dactylellina cionopaga]